MKHLGMNSTTFELLIIFAVLLASFALFGKFDVLESLMNVAATYEDWELDEIIPTAMVLVVCLLVFSVRRWKEALNANDELTDAMTRLNRLEGILHICMSCKEIRDTSGSWHQLEKYLGEHSDAKFSHSLCLSCAKRKYPDAYSESSPSPISTQNQANRFPN